MAQIMIETKIVMVDFLEILNFHGIMIQKESDTDLFSIKFLQFFLSTGQDGCVML